MILALYQHAAPGMADLQKILTAKPIQPRAARELADMVEIADGRAVVRVCGVLVRSPNWATREGYATSYLELYKAIELALGAADRIALTIASPGGVADPYIMEVSRLIFENRERIDAYIDPYGFSAAMWLAVQCGRIFAANDMVELGSIGAKLGHFEYSAWLQGEGVQFHEFVSGEFKNTLTQHRAMSDAEKAEVQSWIDRSAMHFFQAVARGRGVVIEDVRERWGDATIYNATQAIESGLIDGLGKIEDFINGGDEVTTAVTAEQVEQLQKEISEIKAGQGDLIKSALTEFRQQEATAQQIRAVAPKGCAGLAETLIKEGVSYETACARFMEAQTKNPEPQNGQPGGENPFLKQAMQTLAGSTPNPVDSSSEQGGLTDPYSRLMSRDEFNAHPVSDDFGGNYSAYVNLAKRKQEGA